jgi:membrane protein
MEGFTLQILNALNVGISFAIITVIFGLIVQSVADADVKWRDVWVGSIVTTVLFTIVKFFIGFYLGNSAFGSAYGAAGSLVIILRLDLLTLLLSSFLVLSSRRCIPKKIGERIKVNDTAVKVQQIEIEKNENNGNHVRKQGIRCATRNLILRFLLAGYEHQDAGSKQ